MTEETATDDLLPEAGDETQSQPEQSNEEAAGDTLSEAQPDQPEEQPIEEAPEEPDATGTTDDDDLAWAEKKGLDLSDPKKVANILRNADRKVSEAGRSKTQVEQEIAKMPTDDDDPVTSLRMEVASLKAQGQARDYFEAHPDDKSYEAEAVAILAEYRESDPEYAWRLGSNLNHLFAIAKDRHEAAEVAKAKEEGRLEERKALANKQRASSVSPAATTQVEPPRKDPALAAFEAEFDKF